MNPPLPGASATGLSINLNGITLTTLLNSTAFGLIASGVIAVLLAVLIQALREESAEGRKKKQIALLLGYEIAQLRSIAKASLELDGNLFEDYKRQVRAGYRDFRPLNGMAWTRAVYDKSTADLSLLPPRLIPVVSDVYRQMEFCDHLKRIANEVATRGQSLELHNPGASESSAYAHEVDTMQSQFVSYSEMYFANIKVFAETCDKAIRGISQIARIDPGSISEPRILGPTAAPYPLTA